MLHITDADSAEHQSGSANLVIWSVACALPNRAAGAPKLSGGSKLRIEAGTLLAGIYQQSEIEEEYFCNYEVNPAYATRLQAAGLHVSAWGEDRAMRAVELPDRPFFLATLFQPQLSSSAEKPHPVTLAFLRAAAEFRRGRMDSFAERRASSIQA